MTCRAPSSSTSCAGTQSGAQLTYNNDGELASWQNAPSNPTSTATYLYDGQGNRVAQQSTTSGLTTTSVYVSNLEEDSTTGSTTSKRTFYYANGARIATALNGTFTYVASDGLGSSNEALGSSGSVTAAILYAPYGTTRYSSGNMPTNYGFTGQRADAVSGLDYYGARYYDPTAGQFASPDSLMPGGGVDILGLSRYAYVEGNPVLRTDPTGHMLVAATGGGGYSAPTGCGCDDWWKDPASWTPYVPTAQASPTHAPSSGGTSQHQTKKCCDLGAALSALFGGIGAMFTQNDQQQNLFVTPADKLLANGTYVKEFSAQASPGEVQYTLDDKGNFYAYQVYGPDGLPTMRVDLQGRPHGGVETPHVQQYVRNTDPEGNTYVNKGAFRSATVDEVPKAQNLAQLETDLLDEYAYEVAMAEEGYGPAATAQAEEAESEAEAVQLEMEFMASDEP